MKLTCRWGRETNEEEGKQGGAVTSGPHEEGEGGGGGGNRIYRFCVVLDEGFCRSVDVEVR